MSISTDDLTQSLAEALGTGPASEEGLSYARRILEQNIGGSPDRQAIDDLREQQEGVLGALKMARKRIMEQQGPTRAEKLFALSAGLGQPTHTGAIGETAGNVSRNLLPIAQEQRQFEMGRDETLSALDLAESQVFNPVTQAEFDLDKLQYNQEQQNLRAALKTISRGGRRGGRTREAKIQDLMTEWDYTRADASALIDELVDININPKLGVATITKKIFPYDVVEVPISSLRGYLDDALDDFEGGPEGTAIPGESDLRTNEEKEADLYASKMFVEGRSLYEMAGMGTGPWPAILAGGSIVSSLFGMQVATETIIARQGLTMRARDLARTLIDNPRMPVRLIEMALEEAAIEPNMLDTGELMQTRMVELDSYLFQKYLDAVEDAEDMDMGEARRVNQQDNARAIGMFLRDLGVPPELQRRKRFEPKNGADVAASDDIPELSDTPPEGSGMSQAAWDVASREEKAKVVSILKMLNEGGAQSGN